MKPETKQKVFVWLYRTFTYFVPGGIAIWQFLIETLVDKEVTVTQKLGVGGIFTIALMAIIAVYFYGRHFKKKITELNNEILVCLDEDKKKELVLLKQKIESKQEMFHNACFIAPFIAFWLLLVCVENGVMSLRGTMLFVCISMAVGMGFNGVAQWMKGKK